MRHFFLSMGSWMYPLIIISLVIIALSIKKIIDLFVMGGNDEARLEKGLHAILFWGVISAVLGILGQTSGIYNALNAISAATEISPKICAMGFAESFTTTIYGLVVLIISAITWFILFNRFKKLTSPVDITD